MNEKEIIEAQDAENKKEIESLKDVDTDKANKRKHGLAVIRFKTLKKLKQLSKK